MQGLQQIQAFVFSFARRSQGFSHLTIYGLTTPLAWALGLKSLQICLS